MRSEGVGEMKLYNKNGLLFPGFGNVIFSKQCARKLASVGELCDAGMVCVFDKHGLTTFHETIKKERRKCLLLMRGMEKLAYTPSLSSAK